MIKILYSILFKVFLNLIIVYAEQTAEIFRIYFYDASENTILK